jgi:saccharopine dehydrogenase (NAD+, L-lysine-forming)
MKIGLIKEGKIPKDERAPLSPEQCKEIIQSYPEIQLVVQRSPIRRFRDKEYEECGVELVDTVDDCDVILGVKEVPILELISDKIYLFFSHTIKQQKHNRDLLKALLSKNITMIDYECLTNNLGFRLIGFGRFAGIVGCYNTFYAYGKRVKTFDLKRAYMCKDRTEMDIELNKIKLPNDFKLVMTGDGRVANGSLEILEKLKIKRVNVSEFLNEAFNEPVYVQLSCGDYNQRIDGGDFVLDQFFKDPKPYLSTFEKFTKVAHVYISTHFWHSESPLIFTAQAAQAHDCKIQVVGDISCDVNGPIVSTIKTSTIEIPLYGYNPKTDSESDCYDSAESFTVMAVDNLPCELPKDASVEFGKEFINKILPHFFNNDKDSVLERATICKNGKLMEKFYYLTDYANS